MILTEVLQGLSSDDEARRVEGYTIRRTLDCLIAAVCVRTGSAILHHDADFDRLARVTPLEIHRPERG